MARITGKRGQLYLPMGVGSSLSNQALTKSASKTIQGTVYTNQFYGTSSRTMWNKAKVPTVRLQGVVGEVAIAPGTANNTITVAAFQYHKDNSGVQTGTAATLTLTRHATENQWHMIMCNNASGTCAVTVGAVGTAGASFNDTFGAASGPAYITAAKTLLGAVKLTPGSAGLVVASDIVFSNSAGTLMQERSDLPTFTMLPMEGGVLFNAALLACHTGGTARTAYASFYDQYALMAKIGDVEGFTLSGTTATTEMEAMEDIAAESDITGAVKWSGTFSRFFVNDTNVWKTAMERRSAILRLYPDSNASTVYYEGSVVISDWGIDCSVGNAVKENVSFTGDGNLELRGL